MSKKSKPQARDTKHEKDLVSFEQLPEQAKELMKLEDQNEKASGPEQVVTTRKIQDRAHKKET